MNSLSWSSPSERAHSITWISYCALLLMQGVESWQASFPWVVWLIKILPLLIFLPGMLKQNLRSYIWLCFVCLIYFLALVEQNFARPGHPVAVLGVFFVVTLFCAAMLFVRWRAREQKKA